MRVTLIIFALMGLAAIALVAFISTGLLHLSTLDRLAARSGVNPAATQPATEPDDADEPGSPSTAPGDVPDTTQPALVDRAVFLSAEDGNLSGPRIALMAAENFVLKTGAAQADPPQAIDPLLLQPDPFARHGGRMGGGKNGGKRHRPPPPYIAHWFGPDDRVEWAFDSPEAGSYIVNFVYSGPPGRGENGKDGGPFIVSAGNEQIVVSLKHTATPTGFEMVEVGALKLPKGPVHLTVWPQGKITYETAIRLRSVRLFPQEGE